MGSARFFHQISNSPERLELHYALRNAIPFLDLSMITDYFKPEFYIGGQNET